MSDESTEYLLGESDLPTHWVKLVPSLPGDSLPPLHPNTRQSAGPENPEFSEAGMEAALARLPQTPAVARASGRQATRRTRLLPAEGVGLPNPDRPFPALARAGTGLR